jgi:hypothetical protein
MMHCWPARQVLTKELLIQKNLHHTNVLEFFGAFWLEEKFGLVLEFVKFSFSAQRSEWDHDHDLNCVP